MIGQKLNKRYAITARLGKGAMGTVYRATDAQAGQEVAVKVVSSELSVDPAMRERFKREGEALRKLKHPNIVGFMDAFQHDEHYVIVMEYIPGGSLYELIKAGRLPVERARRIALELCDALVRSHHVNIIHRDIKPENVLIDEDGTPKLADFGVARLSAGTRMTRTGTQVGTPYYMAPEAWEGKALDAKADIWSLGVVLFEMLTGQVPFDGDTAATVMTKVLTSQPPDLKKLRAETPTGLVKIITRMLTRDKAQRYQTMRQVAVDLEQGEPTTTPLPTKAEREDAVKTRLVEEKGEQKVAKERVERKTAEKAAHEKAKKETAEKGRLKADELAKQKAAKIKSEREAAVKNAREEERRAFVEKEKHRISDNKQDAFELQRSRIGKEVGVALFILLILGMVFGVWYVESSNARVHNVSNAPTSSTSQNTIFAIEDGSPSSIEIDASSGQNIKVEIVNGHWSVTQPLGVSLNQDSAVAVAKDVASLQILEIFSPVGNSAEDFGLDKPLYVLTIGFSNGDEHKLDVGDVTVTNSGYYVRVDNRVMYVVGFSQIDNLLSLLSFLP
jgi:serine/threonine protein kinase